MTSSRIVDRLARFSSLSRECGGLASGPEIDWPEIDDTQLGTVIPGRAQRETGNPGSLAASIADWIPGLREVKTRPGMTVP